MMTSQQATSQAVNEAKASHVALKANIAMWTRKLEALTSKSTLQYSETRQVTHFTKLIAKYASTDRILTQVLR